MSDQTYDEFVAANANGWVVVYIGKENTPKQPLFVNVTGPFDTQAQARQRAASMRAKYKRDLVREGYAASIMVKISVRPLWNTDVQS